MPGNNAIADALVLTGDVDANDFVGGKLPSGTLVFRAGETTKRIAILVAGDDVGESDELFTVTLSDASAGATITTATAKSTIQNDDIGLPPWLHVTYDKQGRPTEVEVLGTGQNDRVGTNYRDGGVLFQFNGQQFLFDKRQAGSIKRIVFNGGVGNDMFENNTAIASRVDGGAGDDVLNGGSGNDEINGGAGKDILRGRGGADRLDGGDDSDTLDGGDGNDRIVGGAGNDSLDGSAGNDRLEGGTGDDTMYGRDGRDYLFGQDGLDWLYGGAGDDDLYGGLGQDRLFGELGNDRIYGGKGADVLHGNGGNDRLDGEEDDDTVYGHDGNDRLLSRDGKVGNDWLSGGLGNDVFDAPSIEIKEK